MSIRNYLTNKLSVPKFHFPDILPKTPIKRFSHTTQLPTKVDLRSNMKSIDDQSRIGSW